MSLHRPDLCDIAKNGQKMVLGRRRTYIHKMIEKKAPGVFCLVGVFIGPVPFFWRWPFSFVVNICSVFVFVGCWDKLPCFLSNFSWPTQNKYVLKLAPGCITAPGFKIGLLVHWSECEDRETGLCIASCSPSDMVSSLKNKISHFKSTNRILCLVRYESSLKMILIMGFELVTNLDTGI